MPQLLGGFLLATAVGLLGWRQQALSGSGAFGAALIGGLIFGFGGPTWGALIVAFFVGGSLLSWFRGPEKAVIAAGFAKSSRRDLAQTLANGGLGALLAILVGIVTRESPWYPFLTLAYFGALSAASADTWATELGILSPRPPRLITTGEPVPSGLSGGVTPLGLLASAAGGAFMGVSAFGLIQLASLLTTGEWFLQDWFLIPLCTVAGFAGSLVDSVLGATIQRLYFCEPCSEITEQPVHDCGTPARLVQGRSWFDNDVVNFCATLTGALTAILLSPLFL